MSGLSKLCLGTVAFGLDYGITNQSGQVSFDEADKILNFAKAKGINFIDTAQNYGQSEEVLGKLDVNRFNVVTKIFAKDELEKSLAMLKQKKVYALMLHREDEADLESIEKLNEYKKLGLVEKIGVSVYTPETLEKLVETFDLDIVQLPINIFDQRFVPLLKTLQEKKIEIHARSVFLQGLVFMRSNDLNEFFDPIKNIFDLLPEQRLRLALSYVANLTEIDKILVGVTNENQLKEIAQEENFNLVLDSYEQFAIDNEKFINPSLWRLK